MKIKFTLLLCPFFFLACQNRLPQLSSPDGELTVRFRLTSAGAPEYSLIRGSDSVLLWSAMGLETEEKSLNSNFSLQSVSHDRQDITWETVWGEERLIRDNHCSMIVKLRHQTGLRMNIEFRCYDDGIAFRYIFPSLKGNMTIIFPDNIILTLGSQISNTVGYDIVISECDEMNEKGTEFETHSR